MDAWKHLTELAAARHGLVDVDDLRRSGVIVGSERAQLRRLVRDGHLVKVAPRVWRIAGAPVTWLQRLQAGLLPFTRKRDIFTLLLFAVLEALPFSYRHLTLYWRMRGLVDAWRGKKSWEKFGRVGFREATSGT